MPWQYCCLCHDGAIIWTHFSCYWPFVTGEFPRQRPVTRSLDVFFDLRLNKRLSKQSWGLSLWHHCNVRAYFVPMLYSVALKGRCLRNNKAVSKTNRVQYQLKVISPWKNGSHFADDIFECIFLNENAWISIKIPLKFVPKGPVHNNPALVQIIAWCRAGDKPLSEPVMVSLLTHICVTWPQWVKQNHNLPWEIGMFVSFSHYGVCVLFV